MADVTITAAQVQPSTTGGWTLGQGIAGATITAGQPIYADATDGGKLKPADADAEATAAARGIAVSNAADEQPVRYLVAGPVILGSGNLVRGRSYFVSSNAGGICREADVASSKYTTALGLATTTSELTVNLQSSGVTNSA
jgi:hypothetical protein|tara:strand:- start:95 stop:517 length:423 start_codon:yes stop_codon:yes gene_type:complete